MYRVNLLFSFLIILLPISLITGPAIPDITVTLSVIFLILSQLFKKRISDLFQFNWLKLSLYFWIYLLFSSLFAYNVYIALAESFIFLRFLFIPLLIYFFVFDTENKKKIFFIIIFLSIIFVMIDSFYQFLNYNSVTGFQEDIFGYKPEFAPFNRLTGPFKDLVPGAYVSKFAFLGLIFFHLFISSIKLKQTLIIIYLGICGYFTFISGERMAFATFGLGMLIYILFNKLFNKFILSLSFIFMALLILITVGLHPSYNDYTIKKSSSIELGLIVEKKFKCNDNSSNICKKEVNFQPRFFSVIKNFNTSAYGEIYLLSLEMYKNNKIFGIGLNNFKKLCENEIKYNNQLKNIGCVTHPHNYYLQWLVETGPIGLIGFVIYLTLLINYIVKTKSDYELKLISVIIFIILFWPIMSTGSLTKNWLGVSTFFLIGIIAFMNKIKIKKNS